MTIGKKLRRIREDRNMMQKDLAEKIGVTPQLLCQVERGSRSLSLPLAIEVAEVLGCKVTDFFDEG